MRELPQGFDGHSCRGRSDLIRFAPLEVTFALAHPVSYRPLVSVLSLRQRLAPPLPAFEFGVDRYLLLYGHAVILPGELRPRQLRPGRNSRAGFLCTICARTSGKREQLRAGISS